MIITTGVDSLKKINNHTNYRMLVIIETIKKSKAVAWYGTQTHIATLYTRAS
jgi:hypothetical protein